MAVAGATRRSMYERTYYHQCNHHHQCKPLSLPSLLSSPSSLTSSSGSECWWKWGVLASLQYPHIPRCLPLCHHHHHHIIIYHHRCNHRHHHISHLILCSSVCIPLSCWSVDQIKISWISLVNAEGSRWWPIASCKAKLTGIANYLWWVRHPLK